MRSTITVDLQLAAELEAALRTDYPNQKTRNILSFFQCRKANLSPGIQIEELLEARRGHPDPLELEL